MEKMNDCLDTINSSRELSEEALLALCKQTFWFDIIEGAFLIIIIIVMVAYFFKLFTR